MAGMLEFRFLIVPDGQESYEVVARSRDIAHFERTVKGASLKKLAENPSLSELEQLAWMTAHRRGKFGGPLDNFRDTCDFDILNDDEEEDGDSGPTKTAP